jgi:hypothetical protein
MRMPTRNGRVILSILLRKKPWLTVAQLLPAWAGELAEVLSESRMWEIHKSRFDESLANLYMRRFVLGWKMLGLERSLGSRIVTYADDLVITNASKVEHDLKYFLVTDIINGRLDDTGPLEDGARLGLRLVTRR